MKNGSKNSTSLFIVTSSLSFLSLLLFNLLCGTEMPKTVMALDTAVSYASNNKNNGTTSDHSILYRKLDGNGVVILS